MNSPPYDNIDHALRRAFGDPRENYGKMLNFSGVMRSGGGLSPMDQIAQDGLVRYILESHLTAGQRFVLYLSFDTTGRQHHAHTAMNMYTDIFSNDSNRLFVCESIARWARRSKDNAIYPKELMHSLGAWAAHYDRAPSDLRYLRHKIYKQLDGILNNAIGASYQLLAERGLIPGLEAPQKPFTGV